MKKSIFKKAIVSSMLLGLLTVSSSYAAAPVAQQAYYDTFSFKVNGAIQYISDITKNLSLPTQGCMCLFQHLATWG